MVDVFAKMHRKLQTIIMDEHHILHGEIMMILMSTFGEISTTSSSSSSFFFFFLFFCVCVCDVNLVVF
jgi:hypothetical protein